MASTMSHPLCFDVRKVEEKQLCRGPLKIQFYNSPRLGLAVPLNLIIKGFFFFFFVVVMGGGLYLGEFLGFSASQVIGK
jgi:hypothetical protein